MSAQNHTAENMSTVFDNRGEETPRLCILMPLRDDKRVFTFLEGLTKQAGDDIHLYIMNDNQPEPFLNELPSPIKGAIFHRPPCTIADKVNMLMELAKSEWIVMVESDTCPNMHWCEDLLRIIDEGDPDAIHLGGEIWPKDHNLNNVIFRVRPEIPRHENKTRFANDSAWFTACEKKGWKIQHHDEVALLYHNTNALRFNKRFLYYAIDFGYLAARDKDLAFLWRKIVFEGYHFVRGLANMPALLFFFAYYSIKNMFTGRKTKKA